MKLQQARPGFTLFYRMDSLMSVALPGRMMLASAGRLSRNDVISVFIPGL